MEQENAALGAVGDYCTVEERSPGMWKIKTRCEAEELRQEPVNFLEVLREWGCVWMWDDLEVVGGTEWIWQAIESKSLVAVTDGSFMRELYPDV